VVTAKTQYNLKNAREYFEERLCVRNYYNEGERVAGESVGLGAERLRLSGKVPGRLQSPSMGQVVDLIPSSGLSLAAVRESVWTGQGARERKLGRWIRG
jgi:hypothetical protein